jgi:hypothetical protein
MNLYLYILIAILGLSSYFIGVQQMIKNRYSPSTFSRVIWVLLSINSFAGVILSNGSKSSIFLGGIILLGSIAIAVTSFWKGTNTIGKLEYFCLAMLLLSGVIWILFNAPLLNLAISLFAHFIGGLPTYKKVLLNPKSESTSFWLLFFLASLLSIFAASIVSLRDIILPIYFTIFDGSMFILTLRKRGVTKVLSLY